MRCASISQTFTPRVKDLTFSYRSSRSGSLTVGLALILTIETVVLHLLLQAKHPIAAWSLTFLSLVTLAWLAIDYQRIGRESVSVRDGTLTLRVGLRARAEIGLDAVAHAMRPTWKDLPTVGSPKAKGYLNLTKPASPNVLIVLDKAYPVLIASAVRVPTSRIGLHLDDPDGFLAAVNNARGITHVGVI
jgi:hypothetical protein